MSVYNTPQFLNYICKSGFYNYTYCCGLHWLKTERYKAGYLLEFRWTSFCCKNRTKTTKHRC